MHDPHKDEAPLYDINNLPPELLAAMESLPRRTLHYGTDVAVCGAQVPAGQLTDITALVSCRTCLGLVPPPSRGHWAVVYGPKQTEEF